MKTKLCLGIVLPCYNEEAVLPHTFETIKNCLNNLIKKEKVDSNSFLYFVDDGSQDKTWQLICEQHSKTNGLIKGLKLAGNVGHQNALVAGMLTIRDKIDCVITIDADLQDDISVIEKMVDAYTEGNEIVYGVKEKRNIDSYFKKYSAALFYWLMVVLGVKIIKEHADFRLCGSKALDALSNYPEKNLFLRAIFPSMGFKTNFIFYPIAKREKGNTKYSLSKMFSLAWDGITSFSIFPLRIISLIGFIIFCLSMFMAGYVLYVYFLTNGTVLGWASTVLPIYFIGGIQLLCLGIIGEYIGKIYKETKNSPRYIIDIELS